MVWFNSLYLIVSILVCCNWASALSIYEFFNELKIKSTQFFSPIQLTKEELSNVVVYNGCVIYAHNKTRVNFDEINERGVTNYDGESIDFTLFKQPDNYFLINLGTIGNSWNIDQFENFTTIIDNSKVKHNKNKHLFGYTISTQSASNLLTVKDQAIKNLPYIKASVRDLKQYLIYKNMERIPIGIEIAHNDPILTIENLTEYFSCENRYHPNFYFIENKVIDIYQDYYATNITTMNKSCSNIHIHGINANYIPYSPRASRCDCIMTMLKCVVNLQSNLSFVDNDNLLNNICSTVYCGSITNDVSRGHYGVFASCNNLQKYSIAFNLFYTLHNSDENFCKFNSNSKLLGKNKSVDDYMKLLDFEGKQCSEEVMEDWNKYLIGISKIEGDSKEPNRERVYDYDAEFNLNINNNNAYSELKNSLSMKLLGILVLTLIVTFMYY